MKLRAQIGPFSSQHARAPSLLAFSKNILAYDQV